MKISEKTIALCASKGITVKWYPDPTYAAFRKRIWEKNYYWAIDYGRDNVRGSKATTEGRTNVLYNSWDELEQHCAKFATTTNDRHCDPYEYTTLYVVYDNGDKTIVRKEPMKGKVITPEYIESLVKKNEKKYEGTYGRFALGVQSLLKSSGLSDRFAIYPTTYGIGVWVMLNYQANDDIQLVARLLDSRGIDYVNEYSDAHWAYRFKISKKQINLLKL